MNFDEASDAIKGLFNAAWASLAPAANGGALPEIRWPGIDNVATPPAADTAWARVTIQHGPNGSTTLAPAGSRRIERQGLVTIQVFTPNVKGDGLTLAQKLAIIARNAFDGVGTADGLWFRQTYIKEIGPSASWYQMNILSTFQYDEQR